MTHILSPPPPSRTRNWHAEHTSAIAITFARRSSNKAPLRDPRRTGYNHYGPLHPGARLNASAFNTLSTSCQHYDTEQTGRYFLWVSGRGQRERRETPPNLEAPRRRYDSNNSCSVAQESSNRNVRTTPPLKPLRDLKKEKKKEPPHLLLTHSPLPAMAAECASSQYSSTRTHNLKEGQS